MHLLNDKFNTDQLISVADPFFYFGLEKNTPISHSLNAAHIKHFFEYSLKQNPNNLSCHMQRIKFALHKKNHHEFFAALCDLFIILDQQGLSLRQRLFTYAQKKLPQEQVEILSAYLTDKKITDDAEFLPELCFFKKEIIELLTIASHADDKKQTIEDTLHTIESYIKHSQFDAAEDCILSLLKNDPENELLTIKLIDLYKALNYTDKFNQAYEEFADCLLTSSYWDEANQYFLKKHH